MSDALAAFYAARLDDDEAAAKAAAASGPWYWAEPRTYPQRIARAEEAAHIARHDPARVLREVAAKRAILAEHEAIYPAVGRADGGGIPDPEGVVSVFAYCHVCDEDAPCSTLRHLAAVYSDNEGYRDEWKP
jgi:Family of unknown function (DUF6221)